MCVRSLSASVSVMFIDTHIHRCVHASMQGILGVVFHALEDCFLAKIALV